MRKDVDVSRGVDVPIPELPAVFASHQAVDALLRCSVDLIALLDLEVFAVSKLLHDALFAILAIRTHTRGSILVDVENVVAPFAKDVHELRADRSDTSTYCFTPIVVVSETEYNVLRVGYVVVLSEAVYHSILALLLEHKRFKRHLSPPLILVKCSHLEFVC